MMLKRALIAVLVLVVVVFLYIGYSGYDAGRNSVAGTARSRSGDGQISLTSPEATPAGASALPATAPTGAATPQGAELTASSGQGAGGGMTAPATDTIKPNPPNGMTFGGAGHYQLYRQGNLTWRLNTDTGESCVVFATEEEWRKPQVLRAGCHSRG